MHEGAPTCDNSRQTGNGQMSSHARHSTIRNRLLLLPTWPRAAQAAESLTPLLNTARRQTNERCPRSTEAIRKHCAHPQDERLQFKHIGSKLESLLHEVCEFHQRQFAHLRGIFQGKLQETLGGCGKPRQLLRVVPGNLKKLVDR